MAVALPATIVLMKLLKNLLEAQLLGGLAMALASLLVLLILVVLRVAPASRAAIVARVPTVLFGAAILAIVGFGLYYS